MEYFKAEPESDVWKPYVEYVDEMLVAGFLKTIKRSLGFLMDCTCQLIVYSRSSDVPRTQGLLVLVN